MKSFDNYELGIMNYELVVRFLLMRAYAQVCKFKRAHASGCLYDNDNVNANDNVNGNDNVNDNGQRCCAKKREKKK